MEIAQKNLFTRFYEGFWTFLIFSILLTIILISLFIFYIVKFRILKQAVKIFLPIFLLFTLGLIFMLIPLNVEHIKDLNYVKSNQTLIVEGKVIGYEKIHYNESSATVTYSYPIIKSEKTAETISLNVLHSNEKIEIGSLYTFIYLPNTKLAEILP